MKLLLLLVILLTSCISSTDKKISKNFKVITVTAEQLENKLIPISRRAPKYPEVARVYDIEATLKCSFIITAQGQVEDIKIIETTPAGVKNLFLYESIDALRKWKFKPNLINGRPVRVKVFQELEFKLK